MDEFAQLSEAWLNAKERERQAVNDRRSVEDRLAEILELDETVEGTVNIEKGRMKVKVVNRLNHKVDADKLQDIANESGLSDHLPTLFRWKPEINMSSWRKADEGITRVLLGAITTTPSRPSFSISLEGE